jgi:hypothetical protein
VFSAIQEKNRKEGHIKPLMLIVTKLCSSINLQLNHGTALDSKYIQN